MSRHQDSRPDINNREPLVLSTKKKVICGTCNFLTKEHFFSLSKQLNVHNIRTSVKLTNQGGLTVNLSMVPAMESEAASGLRYEKLITSQMLLVLLFCVAYVEEFVTKHGCWSHQEHMWRSCITNECSDSLLYFSRKQPLHGTDHTWLKPPRHHKNRNA